MTNQNPNTECSEKGELTPREYQLLMSLLIRFSKYAPEDNVAKNHTKGLYKRLVELQME